MFPDPGNTSHILLFIPREPRHDLRPLWFVLAACLLAIATIAARAL